MPAPGPHAWPTLDLGDARIPAGHGHRPLRQRPRDPRRLHADRAEGPGRRPRLFRHDAASTTDRRLDRLRQSRLRAGGQGDPATRPEGQVEGETTVIGAAAPARPPVVVHARRQCRQEPVVLARSDALCRGAGPAAGAGRALHHRRALRPGAPRRPAAGRRDRGRPSPTTTSATPSPGSAWRFSLAVVFVPYRVEAAQREAGAATALRRGRLRRTAASHRRRSAPARGRICLRGRGRRSRPSGPGSAASRSPGSRFPAAPAPSRHSPAPAARSRGPLPAAIAFRISSVAVSEMFSLIGSVEFSTK